MNQEKFGSNVNTMSKYFGLTHRPFGENSSSNNNPSFERPGPSGATGNWSPFKNNIFESAENKSQFGSTNSFDFTPVEFSFGRKSWPGTNTRKNILKNRMFLNSTEMKPSFGSTSLFGSTERKPISQNNKGMFSTTANKQPLDRMNMFSSASNGPFFGYSNNITGDDEVGTVGNTKKCTFNFNTMRMPDSENTIYENYGKEMKKLLTDLQGLTECPVCFGSLGLSLKQCENGHGICGSCINNVGNKCPTCQHSYLPYKPILLTQIFDRLPKLCLFADKGCDVMLFDKKGQHEMFCKFRPTSCKFESCDWSGTVDSVVEHVKTCKKGNANILCEMHFPKVKFTRICKFDKTKNANFYSAIIYENQLFWKYFHRDSCSKMISYTFYHIAPSKPTQKYYLVVSFMKGEIEFKTCVASTLETRDQCVEIKNNETSFFLPDDDLERFYDSESDSYVYTQQIIVESICCDKKPR